MGKRIEVTPYKPSRVSSPRNALKNASKASVAPKPKVPDTKKAKNRHTDPLKALEAIRKSRREAMARYRANLKLAGAGGFK